MLQSEPVSIIGVGNPGIQEAYRLIISQIMDENRLYFYKVLEETRQPLSSQLKAKNEYLSDQYQSKLLSLFTKTISPVDVKGEVTPSSKYLSDEVGDSFETSDIPWDLIYADQKIFKTFTAIQIDLLNSYLSESHLVGYDVPPDGDCLFHSLVDQLYYNGFTPLNRTKEPRYDMSTIKKDLSFTINGNLVPELTHVQAGLQARLEIAEKIRDNKLEIYLNSDGHATTVKHAVDIELSDSDPEHYRPELEEGDDTNFNRYIDILKESAVADNLLDGNKTGIWGGQIEIWAAAALYNVNIRVFTLDAYGKIDNINGILYSADSAHEKFPQGNIYNPSSLQGEIKIAWLSLQGTSAHYITLRNDECCLKYLINKSGDVKRYISDSVIIKVGENFNSNFGTFSTLMEPEVSGDSISEDLALCYFTLPSDTSEPKNVYYFGNRIGLQTGDEVGVRFT